MRKFKIINPYAGVDWDSWHHYKTNLHTHSTASDAQVDFSDMIKAYYDEGSERAVCDYIAGMSDTFALRKYNELFIPEILLG